MLIMKKCWTKVSPFATLHLEAPGKSCFTLYSNSCGKLIREIAMKSKGLVLMKPGTKQEMKHKVRAEKRQILLVLQSSDKEASNSTRE
jgi:hypothetical protein